MKLSVILSTYNQPAWLELVLWGYAAQTHRDFELIVADDGSGAETRAVIERMRTDTPLRLQHVWHEDAGYRKCEILNRAIAAAAGEYLIFSDGDCIPRRDFVQVHATLARPGRYLSGGALRLSQATSTSVTAEAVRVGRVFDAAWLRCNGRRGGRHRLRLLRNSRVAAALDALTPTRASWNGGNASTWKDALVAVNGYDHAMRYGGQDRALGERLENSGLRGVQIRHRAVLLHLEHPRPYRSEESIQANRAIRARIRATGEQRTPVGLAELAPDATLRIDGTTALHEETA